MENWAIGNTMKFLPAMWAVQVVQTPGLAPAVWQQEKQLLGFDHVLTTQSEQAASLPDCAAGAPFTPAPPLTGQQSFGSNMSIPFTTSSGQRGASC